MLLPYYSYCVLSAAWSIPIFSPVTVFGFMAASEAVLLLLFFFFFTVYLKELLN